MNDANIYIIEAYRLILSGDTHVLLNGVPRIFYCEKSWQWAPPALKDYDLWCVLGGSGQLTLGEKKYPLRAGACFVIPPSISPHGAHDPSNPLTVFAVHFTPKDELATPAEVFACSVRGASFLTSLAERCEEAARSGTALGEKFAMSLLRQMMLFLLVESEQPSEPMDALINDLCTAIIREPGALWSVDVMARRVSLSRSQLTRRMRRRTHLSPIEFVMQARMERARQLLAETPMTVTEIAEAVGVESVFYFSRLHKARYGISPKAFRDGIKNPRRG